MSVGACGCECLSNLDVCRGESLRSVSVVVGLVVGVVVVCLVISLIISVVCDAGEVTAR